MFDDLFQEENLSKKTEIYLSNVLILELHFLVRCSILATN